jgi:acyl transferase domain-containing protein
LILTVDQHMNTAKLSILSPTSTCHTFDESADGYGRAEGAGALYLKRLSDAIRDRDVIRGVIRSSAVNTNGKVEGMGITHPSVKGQERVVRAAYQRAKLDPNKTAYLECHGTGTPVGDPIEVRAVSNAMNDTRSSDAPLLLGAIKANIGHSEAASGIFAVMKAAMMTESAVIPGVCGLRKLNPAIKETDWNVKVNVDTRPWPEEFDVRRASVSSFGYGGTNGHVIVEAVDSMYPWYEHGKPKDIASYRYNASRPFLIGMSGHNRKTLTRNIEAHQKVVEKFYLPDVAYTLNSRRTKFPSRGFTIATDGQEAAAFDISSFKFGSANSRPVNIGFVFTGQGAQWPGMGVEALKEFPNFAETIDTLDDVLQSVSPAPNWTIRGVLESSKDSSRLGEAEISQPVCTAVQIAIVDLFASWNITPLVVVGHSSGEIAAAYAAGRLSAPEAILAAFFRGVAVKEAAPVGTMLAAGLGASEIQQYIPHAVAEEVTVACENSPNSVTLSGTSNGITAVKKELDDAKIFARELRTGKAYHSAQMNAVAPLYEELFLNAFETLEEPDFLWRRPTIPMISSVTGSLYTEENISIEYWCQNLRSRVLFDSAITTLGQSELFSDVNCLVEVGPHSALAAPIKQICSTNEFSHLAYIPSLIRGSNNLIALFTTAGELFLRGFTVDFEQINSIEAFVKLEGSKKRYSPRCLVDLPPYQWDYDNKFWYEPRFSHEQRRSQFPRHDILGRKIFGLSENVLSWKNILRHRDLPWMKDHCLGGSAVFPGAGHFSLAIEAYMQALEADENDLAGITLRDVNIKTALIIPDTDDGIEIQTRLQKIHSENNDAWYAFTVESVENGVWTTHSEGTIGPNLTDRPLKHGFDCPFKLDKLHQRTSARRWYESFRLVGFEYGPSFQVLNNVRTNGKDRSAAADVHVTNNCGLITGESRYVLHPSTIDGCLQLLNMSVHSGHHKTMEFGVVPLEMEEISLFFPGEDYTADGCAVAWTDKVSGRYFNTHIQLLGASGRPILDIKNLRSVSYEAAVPQNLSSPPARQPCTQVSWKPDITTLSNVQAAGIFPPILSKNQCVAMMIELLNHKTPIQSATILANASFDFVLAIKNSLPMTSKLTVGFSSVEEAENFKAEADTTDMTIIILPESTFQLSEFLSESQDVFVVDESFISRRSSSGFLDQLKSHTSARSYLISSSHQPDTGYFTDLSYSAGLSAPCVSVDCGDLNVTLVNADPIQNGFVHLKRQIAILSAGSSDNISEALTSELIENECEVILSKIEDANIANITEIIINDSEGIVLSTPTEKLFYALRDILCSGKSVVWLTRGVNQGKAISGGMSQGFLRAVRSENAAAQITLIDIDDGVAIENTVPFFLEKLSHNCTKSSGLDMEFWVQHDGVVHVPRLVPHDYLNKLFSDNDVSAVTKRINEDIRYKGFVIDNGFVFEPQETTFTNEKLDDLEAEIQIDLSEVAVEDLNTDFNRPRIVIGKVLGVGSGLSPSLVGQEVVTYTNGPFVTRIKSSHFITIRAELDGENELDTCDPSQLVATFPSLCEAFDAVVRTGKAKFGDHVLLLPSNLGFLDTVARLGRVLGFQTTAVVLDASEKEECMYKYSLDSASLLVAEDVEAIRRLLTSSTSPNLVIANSFSALSQEIWRFIPPMGRFVLCDSSIDTSLNTLPLSRGASFLTTGISTLFTSDQPCLVELLESGIQLIRENKDALIGPAHMLDVEDFNDVQKIRSDGTFQGHGVVEVRYGESVVNVSTYSNPH